MKSNLNREFRTVSFHLKGKNFIHPHVRIQGGVVVYLVVQAYGSLALEDNSEVGEAVLGRCSNIVHLH